MSTRSVETYSSSFWMPRFSWHSSRMPPTCSAGVSIIAVMIGSSIFVDAARDPAASTGCRFPCTSPSVVVTRYSTPGAVVIEVQVELALEPLLDDLHVQQAEEPAAEAEPERRRRLGLEEERRVVQPQLLERLAQLGVLASLRPGRGRRRPSASVP